jgi:hypothetical protein
MSSRYSSGNSCRSFCTRADLPRTQLRKSTPPEMKREFYHTFSYLLICHELSLTPAEHVWVHMCNRDHPQALANYQARGMVVYKIEEGEEKSI